MGFASLTVQPRTEGERLAAITVQHLAPAYRILHSSASLSLPVGEVHCPPPSSCPTEGAVVFRLSCVEGSPEEIPRSWVEPWNLHFRHVPGKVVLGAF